VKSLVKFGTRKNNEVIGFLEKKIPQSWIPKIYSPLETWI